MTYYKVVASGTRSPKVVDLKPTRYDYSIEIPIATLVADELITERELARLKSKCRNSFHVSYGRLVPCEVKKSQTCRFFGARFQRDSDN